MFQEGIKLKDKSSFKIGGEAKWFLEAEDTSELIEAIRETRRYKTPFYVLGGGTNILWSDDGFDGLVLRPTIKSMEMNDLDITVGAGVSMGSLIDFTVSKGLSGLEWAGGLPGALGGAIRGNAGAFGGEIKDSVIEIWSLDAETLKIQKRSVGDCGFGYRTSVFKEKAGREIILRATLRFKSGDKRAIRESIEEKINFRKSRHPMEYPSAGSIFKNVLLTQIDTDQDADKRGLNISVNQRTNLRKSAFPVEKDPFPVVPAAYLISKAGLKGASIGGAMVSPKHPNFIVNIFSATADDVKKLINFIKAEILLKFGVKLEEEIQILANH